MKCFVIPVIIWGNRNCNQRTKNSGRNTRIHLKTAVHVTSHMKPEARVVGFTIISRAERSLPKSCDKRRNNNNNSNNPYRVFFSYFHREPHFYLLLCSLILKVNKKMFPAKVESLEVNSLSCMYFSLHIHFLKYQHVSSHYSYSGLKEMLNNLKSS